jgi:hypothetical protein
MKNVAWKFSIIGLLCIFLAACSDGGGGSSSSSASSTVSGVAAAGAPIIGTVTLKDSSTPAQTKTVPIAANGSYTVDVTGLKAPFMMRADGYEGGNEYHLYSAATEADLGGTINITPLTDLIVANIANTIAEDYFESGNFSTLTATELTTEANALRDKLLPVLQAVGVSSSIDLLRASFSTDHTGLDAALDILRVETTDATTGAATITNIITQQQIASNDTAVMTTTTGVSGAVTDIQAISNGFKQFSNLFATSLPSEANTTLRGLFDSTTFIDGGQDLDSFLSELTTEQFMIGISFTNISLVPGTAEFAGDVMTRVQVSFDVVKNGQIVPDGPPPFWMIKKENKWYIQGNLFIADIEIYALAEYRTHNFSTSEIVNGLRLNIEDRGGRGITSAVVTGKGLPAEGVTLLNNIASERFEISAQNQDNLYVLTDAAITSIADAGEEYTVKLYTNATLSATYTLKLRKRPRLSTELTAANFPAITAPSTQEQLASFAGGTGTISWTVPDGIVTDGLSVDVYDNSSNNAEVQYDLEPTDRSKSIIFSPLPTFTPTGGWLWLGAMDSYGREFARSISFWQ